MYIEGFQGVIWLCDYCGNGYSVDPSLEIDGDDLADYSGIRCFGCHETQKSIEEKDRRFWDQIKNQIKRIKTSQPKRVSIDPIRHVGGKKKRKKSARPQK